MSAFPVINPEVCEMTYTGLENGQCAFFKESPTSYLYGPSEFTPTFLWKMFVC